MAVKQALAKDKNIDAEAASDVSTMLKSLITYRPHPTETQHTYRRKSTIMSTLQEQTAAFAEQFANRPIPATGPIDTSPIDATPDTDEYDAIWQRVVTETRARGNDFHLPISVAYAQRLCDAYPTADRELVLIATLLHDTGWSHVDENRIISEGFRGDWRKADIRYEHEVQGCKVARRVLPDLNYSPEFVEKVCAIIDGHDTREEA